MNFAAATTTGMAASYKVIADNFHPAEFNLMRNCLSFVVALIWLGLIKTNPIKAFPTEKKWALFWRCITGQANFLLLNIASAMAPISLVMVFW